MSKWLAHIWIKDLIGPLDVTQDNSDVVVKVHARSNVGVKDQGQRVF